MAQHGRGAWTKTGMPEKVGTGYYQLLDPQVGAGDQADLSFRAVNHGVKAIQKRINNLAIELQHANGDAHPAVTLKVDGHFGSASDAGLRWAQRQLHVTADGQAGPKTCTAMFVPVIRHLAGPQAFLYGGVNVPTAICHLESGFDPGAVGYVVDNDLGLSQINLQSNPGTTEAEAFDFQYALKYLVDRVKHAYQSYTNKDAAIVSYNSPAWAKEWEKTGKAPTDAAQNYVNLVHAWTP